MNSEVMLRPEFKRYKLYLVELDDYDRERVISATVDVGSIDIEVDHADVVTDYDFMPVKIFAVGYRAKMELSCVPREDGTLFTIENFMEEDDEGSQEHES